MRSEIRQNPPRNIGAPTVSPAAPGDLCDSCHKPATHRLRTFYRAGTACGEAACRERISAWVRNLSMSSPAKRSVAPERFRSNQAVTEAPRVMMPPPGHSRILVGKR